MVVKRWTINKATVVGVVVVVVIVIVVVVVLVLLIVLVLVYWVGQVRSGEW